MEKMEGRNGGTLNRLEKGERPPGAGRAKGSRNRSTIIRELFAFVTLEADPLTGKIEELGQEYLITAAAIVAAKDGDIAAYKALMDSAYGAPKQEVEANIGVRQLIPEHVLNSLSQETLDEIAIKLGPGLSSDEQSDAQ